ncbi:efflux RND transporter permease subunit [Motiliproteus sp. SC1-56]|uniref:efflux RND transporter permease subunit n=1 Tax=Motiliproteus sp. SC1-56 TaxID=2799565 RepID=UPI001A8D41B3|nr:efflux RND transporter permease subunit [Motiliproteus sp. SC1-56]
MIAWFARNPVAANLLMVLILALGGHALLNRTPLEVFPTIELERINVTVSYPGASPAEVEEGITIRIEEAVQDLEGIEQISSRSSEGAAQVNIEVAKGYDTRFLLDDVKSRVDAINRFPEEAERPVVNITEFRREVISAVVYGERDPMALRQIAERVRDDLAALPGVTQVYLDAPRRYELAIEVPELVLQEYGLTLAQVAEAVRRGSLDLSAGNIRTRGADILVRTRGQAYSAEEFRRIPILTRADGSRIELGDLAHIDDGFAEDPIKRRFDGQPAVGIEVYRVGNQNSIEVAAAVRDYLDATRHEMPEGVQLGYWRDRSKIVKARLTTLTNSALQGGLLVMLLLTLFLRPTVAFWVCVGIPISFMGGFLLMPELGVTLNIASLFAFILVLGIVVDDAIVTGENVYSHFSRHGEGLRAAIEGTREVAVPVTFGVLTTVAAFIPLLLIEGRRGAIFEQIPLVVIPVLLFSLVESKLILPAHLRHLKPPRDYGVFSRFQQGVARGLERFIAGFYSPFLDRVLERRYLALAAVFGVALLVLAAVLSGWTRFVFFPRVQSEVARAALEMPVGTPFAVTDRQISRITEAAQALQAKYVDPGTGESVITHILSTTGAGEGIAANRGRVMFEIVAPELRTLEVTSSELVREWRRLIGAVPGAQSITYRAEIGRSSDPLDIQLRGDDLERLRQLAGELRQRLAGYPHVFDISDSLSNGKQELQLALTPEAELLGVSLIDLARQVRQAFFGFEVQRIQRGRDEVKVLVRYPAAERYSLETLERMKIRTPEGLEVPFREVAELRPELSPATIYRIDRKRTVNVRADANKELADLTLIKRDLQVFLDDRLADYPGIQVSFEGEAKEQRDSFSGLFWGMLFVLFVVFCLLAIPFRSYAQPFIVMSVIPFGLVGAVFGHWLMEMNLTIMSLMGMLALTGVVVNDSLVLVDYINRQKRQGVALGAAVRAAGAARFRPVLLTSLTTFAGLMPLIFEKSTQAQFLIPMAVSLGFGILFATLITLLVVPVNYLVLEDLRRLFGAGETHPGAPEMQKG